MKRHMWSAKSQIQLHQRFLQNDLLETDLALAVASGARAAARV
jgi:hypothetical protein